MLNPLELNDMITLLPHLVAVLLYIFLFFAASWNFLEASIKERTIPASQKHIAAVQAMMAVYFVFLDYYWMSTSVIGDEPTTMQIAWTVFHYFNPLTHLYIALNRYIDRWIFK